MSYSSTRRSTVTTAALLVVALAPAISEAQDVADTAAIFTAEPVPTVGTATDTSGSLVTIPDIRRDTVRADSIAAAISVTPGILNKRDLAIAAGFTAAAVALFPLDKELTRWVRSEGHLDNGLLKGTMAGAEWGVEKGAVIAGVGLWGAGLIARNRTVAGIGAHTMVSMTVTHQVTQVLKGAFGRSRPYYSADSLPHDWQWGSGFGNSDRRSFPSGHTSTAFAFATAMSSEISRAWPRAGKVATPLLFAGATSAALARIYQDQHWASDVALGAAVGILTTRATLRFLHGHPGNLIDKIALNTRIVPESGGVTLAVTLPAP